MTIWRGRKAAMSDRHPFPTCSILGVNIAVTDMKKTVSWLEAELPKLSGSYICVSNVHTTVTAYEDESYRAVQNGAALALPDGRPLSLTSRKRGFAEAERVTGPCGQMPRPRNGEAAWQQPNRFGWMSDFRRRNLSLSRNCSRIFATTSAGFPPQPQPDFCPQPQP